MLDTLSPRFEEEAKDESEEDEDEEGVRDGSVAKLLLPTFLTES